MFSITIRLIDLGNENVTKLKTAEELAAEEKAEEEQANKEETAKETTEKMAENAESPDAVTIRKPMIFSKIFFKTKSFRCLVKFSESCYSRF